MAEVDDGIIRKFRQLEKKDQLFYIKDASIKEAVKALNTICSKSKIELLNSLDEDLQAKLVNAMDVKTRTHLLDVLRGVVEASDESDSEIDDIEIVRYEANRDLTAYPFLEVMKKLLTSFGDVDVPDDQTAATLSECIEDWLKETIQYLPTCSVTHIAPRYPYQTHSYLIWKKVKDTAAKDLKETDDEVPDTKEDEEIIGVATEAAKVNIDNSNTSYYTYYEYRIDKLKVKLGPHHRLEQQDTITKVMDRETYFKYHKIRETHLLTDRKKFIRWAKLKKPTQTATNLLAYITWDVIGMIVEIALKINSYKDEGLTSHHIRRAFRYLKTIDLRRPYIVTVPIHNVAPSSLVDENSSHDKLDTEEKSRKRQKLEK